MRRTNSMDGVKIDRDELLSLLEDTLVQDKSLSSLEKLEQLARDKTVDGRAVPYLIVLLRAPDAEVRRKASWLMGKLAQNKVTAFWPLEQVNGLLHDDDPEIRENAAWTIGELTSLKVGTQGSIEHLNHLLGDEQADVRSMAAWALGRMAERLQLAFLSSIEPLKALITDESGFVRKSAQYALERIWALGIADDQLDRGAR